MRMVHETQCDGQPAVRLFTSDAEPRKNSVRIHYHSFIEFSLIESGKGIYKTTSGNIPISAGDIFFFRPNEPHCVTDIEGDGMKFLNLHVAPYYLYGHFSGALGADYTKILTTHFPLPTNKLNGFLAREEIEKLTAIIRAMKMEYENDLSDCEIICDGLAAAMYITVARAFPDKKPENSGKLYSKILASVKYIDKRHKEDLSLEQIAASAGYNKCYFSSVFKKCMGMSVWDYICIRRTEEAMRLIKTTDMSILDIAYECGFNNTANFNKIFKKYTNVLPHTMRR